MNMTQTIQLDLSGADSYGVRVHAKQGDRSTRFIRMELRKDQKPYLPPAGVTAQLRCRKPDGCYVVEEAQRGEDGSVTAELTDQMLACAGTALADLALYGETGEILSVTSFAVEVHASPCGAVRLSKNEFLEAESAAVYARNMAQQAEASARKSSEAAKNCTLDRSLKQHGQPAEAWAVGAAMEDMGYRLSDVVNPPLFQKGKYVTADGRYVEDPTFDFYGPIHLKEGDKLSVEARGYLTYVAMITVEDTEPPDEEHRYISLTSSDAEHTDFYAHVAQREGDYFVSCMSNFIPSCQTAVYEPETAKILREMHLQLMERELTPAYPNAGFVHAETGEFIAHGDYTTTDAFPLYCGESIRFSSSVADEGAIAVLSRWTEDGTFLGTIEIGSTERKEVRYTATAPAEFLRICKHSHKLHRIGKITLNYQSPRGFSEEIAELRKQSEPGFAYDVFPFLRLGIAGDSLASGAVNYHNESGTLTVRDNPDYSWGRFLEREYGVAVSLFSGGGTSTRTWLTRSYCKDAMMAAEPCDAYLIALGTNDSYLYGMDYLGSAADLHPGSEETGNPDTFFGNYGRIVAAMRKKSPNCKIFAFTMARAHNEAEKAYNEAIRTICGAYEDLFCIDLESDPYFTSPLASGTWYQSHSTACGYRAFSQHIWKRLNDYIREHLASFADVPWILNPHD